MLDILVLCITVFIKCVMLLIMFNIYRFIGDNFDFKSKSFGNISMIIFSTINIVGSFMTSCEDFNLIGISKFWVLLIYICVLTIIGIPNCFLYKFFSNSFKKK